MTTPQTEQTTIPAPEVPNGRARSTRRELTEKQLEHLVGGEAAARMQCANNLKQLGLALH